MAKDNLGVRAGVVAGTALLLDYMLNVAVGISAGVGAVVSAVPILQKQRLAFCLLVLIALTLINLRGVRETGITFLFPVLAFVLCIGSAMIIGVVQAVLSGGRPRPAASPPAVSAATQAVSVWMLLRAFASGCTAMTGVEAVSNAIPLFR